MPTPEELQAEIQELRVIILNLNQKEKERLTSKYDDTYKSLRNAILKTTDLENIIEDIYEKLGITDLLSDLILINNPYGDKLGFKFSDIIENKIKDILLKDLPENEGNDGRKNRFIRIIKKIIDNPIADVLLKSNPVGSIVSTVINTASNFINTTVEKIESTQIGNGIKKIAVTTKDEIANDKIVFFKDSMKKYSDFYSEMLKVSEQFDTRIDIIKNSFESTYVTYKNLNVKYLQTLKIENIDPFEGLDLLFEKSAAANADFDYSAVFNKSEIVSGLDFISKLPDTETEIEKYSNEFAKTFRDFITNYVEVLNTPIKGNWDKNEIDIDKLKNLILKLNNYLSSNTIVNSVAVEKSENDQMFVISFNSSINRYIA